MSIKVPDSLNAQIYLNQKRAIGAPPVGQTPLGPSIVTRPVINGLPYDGETLTLTTQPVWDIDGNNYVNPELVGGAASGPADGSNPPTAHGIGFNTVNSGPVDNGDGTFDWEINSEEASGRSFLTYGILQNHPGLVVGDKINLRWTVQNKTVGAGGVGLALSSAGVTGVSIVFGTTVVPRGETLVVDATVTITAPTYDATIRVGTGPTTNASEYFRISNPVAYVNTAADSDWVWQVSGVDQPGTEGTTTFDVTGLIAVGSLVQVRAYASNAEGDRSALSNALRVVDRPVPPSPPTSNMWMVELA